MTSIDSTICPACGGHFLERDVEYTPNFYAVKRVTVKCLECLTRWDETPKAQGGQS